jgi:hypothetical protein
MNWRCLTVVAIAGLVSLGCDKIPFLGKKADDAAQAEVVPDTTPTPAAPVAATPQAPEPQPVEPEPQQAPVRRASATTSQVGEEPWFPTETGTIGPGMTADEVIGIWGAPVTERTAGNWTFLYFRNGCERACGTFDIVMLEGGQVVDAIVRGVGHTYAGLSSAPPSRVAEFTPPVVFADTVGVNG